MPRTRRIRLDPAAYETVIIETPYGDVTVGPRYRDDPLAVAVCVSGATGVTLTGDGPHTNNTSGQQGYAVFLTKGEG